MMIASSLAANVCVYVLEVVILVGVRCLERHAIKPFCKNEQIDNWFGVLTSNSNTQTYKIK